MPAEHTHRFRLEHQYRDSDGASRTVWQCEVCAVNRPPMPDERPWSTCDWGQCDRRASSWRYSLDHGWLPVCRTHAEPVDVFMKNV